MLYQFSSNRVLIGTKSTDPIISYYISILEPILVASVGPISQQNFVQ